jgi:hypothetical protein
MNGLESGERVLAGKGGRPSAFHPPDKKSCGSTDDQHRTLHEHAPIDLEAPGAGSRQSVRGRAATALRFGRARRPDAIRLDP